MVDLDALTWEGWLDDATFFPAAKQPTDSFSLDELLTNQKVGVDNDADAIVGLPDLDWLDAKVDISAFNPGFILDDGQNFTDAFSLLLDSVPYDPHTFCPPLEEEQKISPASSSADLTLANNIGQNGVADILLGSPFYEPISPPTSPDSFNANPVQVTDQFCLSPKSTTSFTGSNSDLVTVDDFILSPEAASSYCSTPRSSLSPEDFNPGDQDMILDMFQIGSSPMQTDEEEFSATTEASQNGIEDVNNLLPEISTVSVEVCTEEESDEAESAPVVEETLSIEDVTASMRRKRYVNDGKAIPKVQVSLRNMFHPYERTTTTKKPRDRVQRKKVQNKEAAARYRIKKRNEEKELSDEVSTLESEQRELQKKHDALAMEIKYLKSLMREMFQKKGMLK